MDRDNHKMLIPRPRLRKKAIIVNNSANLQENF